MAEVSNNLFTIQSSNANKLSRELLRWIQSLDLAFSIKNVKRDFANGFLVAEIMSRYYSKDISMHSYDNGVGLKVKKDNWEQLMKIFQTLTDLELVVSKSEIDEIIHCENGAAVNFISKLYQCLTKRIIQPIIPPSKLESSVPDSSTSSGNYINADGTNSPSKSIPNYAKMVSSTFIRESMRKPEIVETVDDLTRSQKIQDLYLQHDETVQAEKLALDTPERLYRKPTVLRGAIKSVTTNGNTSQFAQQVVKEVNIKSMTDSTLEKLRIARETKENEAITFNKVGYHTGAFSELNGRVGCSEIVQTNPMEMINDIVSKLMQESNLLMSIDAHKTIKGIDTCNFSQITRLFVELQSECDVEAAHLLDKLAEKSIDFAQSFVDFPKEFWKFSGLIFMLINELESTRCCFHSACNLIQEIGRKCVQRGDAGSLQLLIDWLLPKIIENLRQRVPTRKAMLQIVYAYSPASILSHIQVIKCMREALEDNIPLFIQTLAILIRMEPELDETLGDLYYYYCEIGLSKSCATIRAASLSMLEPLMMYNSALTASVLHTIKELSSQQNWWEVKAQLLIVASLFIYRVATLQPEYDANASINLAYSIIENEFHLNASLNIRRLGLFHLSKNLSFYPELVPAYVDVLLSVPKDVRHAIMRGSGNINSGANGSDPFSVLPILGNSGVQYETLTLRGSWDAVAIAKQLYYDHSLTRYPESEVLYIIFCCFDDLCERDQYESICVLYDQLKQKVVQGFYKKEACNISADIIRCIVNLASSKPIPSEIVMQVEFQEIVHVAYPKMQANEKSVIRELLSDLVVIDHRLVECIERYKAAL